MEKSVANAIIDNINEMFGEATYEIIQPAEKTQSSTAVNSKAVSTLLKDELVVTATQITQQEAKVLRKGVQEAIYKLQAVLKELDANYL